MARRRMIEVSIAYDERFNAVSEFAQLLFLKILPHTDDLGRFDGIPKIIKARIMPLSNRKEEDVLEAIIELLEIGLLNAYLGQNRVVIYYNTESFRRINAVLVKNNTSNKSEYPEPETELDQISYADHVRSRAGMINREYKVKSKEYKVKSNKYNEESFNRFWERYPKRIGKGQAVKAWEKINPDNELLDKILSSVDAQIASGQLNKGQYTKNPSTWLNAECWNDEIIIRSENEGNRGHNTRPESSTGANAIRDRFSPENLAKSKYHKPNNQSSDKVQ